MYTKKVYEHFLDPQNARSMPDADAVGTIGDPSCGDSVTMFIKVRDNVISDVSYLVFGCGASIATSSMASVLAKGKSLEDAMAMADEDVIEALGGLPEHKVHCSNLGVSALHKAIGSYLAIGREHGDSIVVVGTHPPCSRCRLLSNVVAAVAAEFGLDASVKHLSYTSEEARGYAIRNGLVPGTAKDVSMATGIEIDHNALADFLSASAPDDGGEFGKYNDCGWTIGLDEMLRPLEKIAKEAGIMMTPALIINGTIKHQGSMPALPEIRKWLMELKKPAADRQEP